jgi:hypothetical protein
MIIKLKRYAKSVFIRLTSSFKLSIGLVIYESK